MPLRRIAIGRLRDRIWETIEPDGEVLARLADHGLIEPATDHIQLSRAVQHSLQPDLRPGPHGSIRWPLDDRRARGAAA